MTKPANFPARKLRRQLDAKMKGDRNTKPVHISLEDYQAALNNAFQVKTKKYRAR